MDILAELKTRFPFYLMGKSSRVTKATVYYLEHNISQANACRKFGCSQPAFRKRLREIQNMLDIPKKPELHQEVLVQLESKAQMVGSTQIMIRSSIYQKLKRFRDKNQFRSFTVAIEKLLDADAELTHIYSELSRDVML